MNDTTINNDMTMGGGAGGALLAGRGFAAEHFSYNFNISVGAVFPIPRGLT